MTDFVQNWDLDDDPDNELEKLISTIKDSEDKAFPPRSKTQSKKLRKPWMTNGIRKSMDRRDKLFLEQLGKNDAKLSKEFRLVQNKVY